MTEAKEKSVGRSTDWYYWGNCVQAKEEDIHSLRESAIHISWWTFRKYIPEARKFFQDRGGIFGASNKEINESYFFDFYRGSFRGEPCLFAVWSGFEWVWLRKPEQNKEGKVT